MAFVDDVANLVAGEISHIGLGTSETTEVSGGGYSHMPPAYSPASGGQADLASVIEFDGLPNSGPITHLLLKRSGTLWRSVPVTNPKSFNANGRLDVNSAAVAVSVGS